MAKSARSKISNYFVWALLGLLIVGLTGFGINSVGSSSSLTVGAVGQEEITANSYAQALNNEMRATSTRFGTNVTFDMARSIGLDQQVLGRLLATAALDGEANIRGLSVGDNQVRDRLLATEAFNGLSGTFDETAYRFALSQAGLSAAEYDSIVRKETTRTILQTAIISGVSPDDTYAKTLFSFLGEGRSFRYTVVTGNSGVNGAPDPSATQIADYYTANPAEFTAPLTRKISFVLLTTEALIPSVQIDDAALLELYNDQTERFHIPARRIVDRLVFATQETADAAMTSLQAGDMSFEAVVQSRGLEIGDVGLGDVMEDDLNDGANEGVFALTEPGLVGPLTSAYGPAIYRVNAILAAQSTTFEEARAELQQELAQEKAVRIIDDTIGQVDDLLAGGASLEDIAAETEMGLGTIDYTADSQDGIAAYAEFRTEAGLLTADDFAEVKQLPDGSIYAIRLDATIEPTLKPLADVNAQAITSWKIAANRAALLKTAEKLKLLLTSGGSFKNLELAETEALNIRRDGTLADVPATLVADVFEIEVGDVALIPDGERILLARLIDVIPFTLDDAANQSIITDLSSQFGNQLSVDIYEAYAAGLQNDAGITVNQPVIAAVHRQFTSTGGAPAQNPAPAHNPMP